MKSRILIAVACACGLMVQKAAATLPPIHISIDEVHNTATVAGALPGTIELLDPSGAISDELVFSATVPGSVQLLSDPADEAGAPPADVSAFPTNPPLPIVTVTEMADGSAKYIATGAGMNTPGFVPTESVPIEYDIQSDGDATPLPSAAYGGIALLALLGLVRALRRRPSAG